MGYLRTIKLQMFYNAGKDEEMPSPMSHAKKVIRFANGEKTLKYYEDAEHCIMNYFDEVFPEILDSIKKEFEIINT